MLIPHGEGYMCGPYDAIVILHDVAKGTFHSTFFEEHPMPGPIKTPIEGDPLKLLSKTHHTEGSPNLEGALKHAEALAAQIGMKDGSVIKEPVPWNGELGIVLLAVYGDPMKIAA